MATATARLRSSEVRVRYADGCCRDAVILTLNGAVMRVAVQGCDDAVEFTLINGNWFCEELEPVSFEFLCALEERDSRGSTARVAAGRMMQSISQ